MYIEQAEEFSKKSHWDKSSDIMADAPWQTVDTPGRFSDVRNVTWARLPYRYMLTEYAERNTGLFRRAKLNSKLFELAMLSARKVSTQTHDYKRYFITKNPDQLFLIPSEVESPEIERQSGHMAANSNFILDNGLFVPNHDDISVLDHALEYGYLDGVEPFER